MCARQPEPEALKAKLEDFLMEHGVEHKNNTTSRFANCINRTLV